MQTGGTGRTWVRLETTTTCRGDGRPGCWSGTRISGWRLFPDRGQDGRLLERGDAAIFKSLASRSTTARAANACQPRTAAGNPPPRNESEEHTAHAHRRLGFGDLEKQINKSRGRFVIHGRDVPNVCRGSRPVLGPGHGKRGRRAKLGGGSVDRATCLELVTRRARHESTHAAPLLGGFVRRRRFQRHSSRANVD